MVDEINEDSKEEMIYREFCEIGLYGNDDNRREAIKLLEEMKTEKAVDVLLKILLFHPYGKHCGDCDYNPRNEAIIPLLRLWKVAPGKIIPLLPFFFGRIRVSEELEHSYYGATYDYDKIDKETFQKLFISGLNDYDSLVRAGVFYWVDEEIIKNNLQLLMSAYKIENNEWVIKEIEEKLLYYLNEEIFDEFIELIRNYGKKMEDGDYEIAYSENVFDFDEEQVKRVVPLLLRKWKEEKDKIMKGSLKVLIDNMLSCKEKINHLFSEEEIKQLQEMEIIKK
ncbi:MAG: hypothetical protein FK730_01285 [Asgard group archaeon]|nr:hypothetical protein [Asgard group archaeon]